MSTSSSRVSIKELSQHDPIGNRGIPVVVGSCGESLCECVISATAASSYPGRQRPAANRSTSSSRSFRHKDHLCVRKRCRCLAGGLCRARRRSDPGATERCHQRRHKLAVRGSRLSRPTLHAARPDHCKERACADPSRRPTRSSHTLRSAHSCLFLLSFSRDVGQTMFTHPRNIGSHVRSGRASAA